MFAAVADGRFFRGRLRATAVTVEVRDVKCETGFYNVYATEFEFAKAY